MRPGQTLWEPAQPNGLPNAHLIFCKKGTCVGSQKERLRRDLLCDFTKSPDPSAHVFSSVKCVGRSVSLTYKESLRQRDSFSVMLAVWGRERGVDKAFEVTLNPETAAEEPGACFLPLLGLVGL